MYVNRRHALQATIASTTLCYIGLHEQVAAQQSFGVGAHSTADDWLAEALITKASNSALRLHRFVDPVYIVMSPVVWTPNPGQEKLGGKITVPVGFVTDLASVPAVFWTLLPRDGVYAYSAIVHDYLYWHQQLPRPTADLIFKSSMEDLEVPKTSAEAIYTAVSKFGGRAWADNARLKRDGERRILKKFPTNHVRWNDWKTRKSVFS